MLTIVNAKGTQLLDAQRLNRVDCAAFRAGPLE